MVRKIIFILNFRIILLNNMKFIILMKNVNIIRVYDKIGYWKKWYELFFFNIEIRKKCVMIIIIYKCSVCI